MVPKRLPFRRPLVVQLAQRPVQIELLLGQHGQLGVVAAALGLGNLLALFALAAHDDQLVQRLDRAAHFGPLLFLIFNCPKVLFNS